MKTDYYYDSRYGEVMEVVIMYDQVNKYVLSHYLRNCKRHKREMIGRSFVKTRMFCRVGGKIKTTK